MMVDNVTVMKNLEKPRKRNTEIEIFAEEKKWKMIQLMFVTAAVTDAAATAAVTRAHAPL